MMLFSKMKRSKNAVKKGQNRFRLSRVENGLCHPTIVLWLFSLGKPTNYF